MLWGEVWVIAGLCVGEERRFLAANSGIAEPADKTEQKATRTRISRKMVKNPKNKP